MTALLASYSIGLDIGMEGCACVLPRNGRPIFHPMPYVGKHLDLTELIELLSGTMLQLDRDGLCVPYAAFESLNSFGQGRQSAFNFGGSYHCVWNLPRLMQIHPVEVKACDWKRAIMPGLPHDGKDGKKASIAYALRRWPGVDLMTKRHLDDNKAECAELAEYAMRYGDRAAGKAYAHC